jgi:hypothetical protein
MAPTDKVSAAAAAAAGVVLLAWILELLGITMPAQVQTSVGVLLVVAAGYFKTERGALAAAVASRRQGRHE